MIHPGPWAVAGTLLCFSCWFCWQLFLLFGYLSRCLFATHYFELCRLQVPSWVFWWQAVTCDTLPKRDFASSFRQNLASIRFPFNFSKCIQICLFYLSQPVNPSQSQETNEVRYPGLRNMHLEIEAEHGEGGEGVEGAEKEVRHRFVAQHISSLKARIRSSHLKRIEMVPNQTSRGWTLWALKSAFKSILCHFEALFKKHPGHRGIPFLHCHRPCSWRAKVAMASKPPFPTAFQEPGGPVAQLLLCYCQTCCYSYLFSQLDVQMKMMNAHQKDEMKEF